MNYDNMSFGAASHMGLPVVTNWELTVTVEDWSRVRSPGRARRRAKQGHRQNWTVKRMPDPKIYQIQGRMHMHPHTLDRLKEEIGRP